MTNPNPKAPDGDGNRNRAGRFVTGNRAAKGNPHARKVAALRAALLATVTPADVRKVVARLVDSAKAGEPWAVRELLDRCLGKARPTDDTDAPDGVVRIMVEHVDTIGQVR